MVKVTNTSATFHLDGKNVGSGKALNLHVRPGKHTLTVTARGRKPEEKTFMAAAGGMVSFDLALKWRRGGKTGGKKGGTQKPIKGNQDDPDKTLDPFSGR